MASVSNGFPRFKDQSGEASFHVGGTAMTPIEPHNDDSTGVEDPVSSPLSASHSTLTKPEPSAPLEDNPEYYSIPTATNYIAPTYADVRLLTDRSLLELPSLIGNPYSPGVVEVLAVPAVQVELDQEENQNGATTRRPAFVSATVIKPRMDCRLGLALAEDAESRATYVSKFNPDAELARILALSPLCVGDMILSVNDTNCFGLSPREIVALLRSIEGPLTISVENVSGDPLLVETMIEKPSVDCKIGLSLRYSFIDGGFLQVSSVSDLFANTFVRPGDRIIFVNGERPRTVQAAIQLIAQAPRFVSLTVESRGVVVAKPGFDENGDDVGTGTAQADAVDSAASPPVASCCTVM